VSIDDLLFHLKLLAFAREKVVTLISERGANLISLNLETEISFSTLGLKTKGASEICEIFRDNKS
jgi:hypothetical protein